MEPWVHRVLQGRIRKGPSALEPLFRKKKIAEVGDIIRRRVVSSLMTIMRLEDTDVIAMALEVVTNSELVSFVSECNFVVR